MLLEALIDIKFLINDTAANESSAPETPRTGALLTSIGKNVGSDGCAVDDDLVVSRRDMEDNNEKNRQKPSRRVGGNIGKTVHGQQRKKAYEFGW